MSTDVIEPLFPPSRMNQGLGVRGFRGLGDLGADIFCMGGSCTTGDASVRQMVSTFASIQGQFAPGDQQLQVFINQFSPQVKDLQSEAAGIGWTARFFILGQGCCAMKEIGERAVAVTEAMFAFKGLKSPVSTPPAVASLMSTLLSFVLPVAVIGGAAYLLAPSVRGWVNTKLGRQHVAGLDRAFSIPKKKRVQKLLPKNYFDKRSFRWVKSGKARILIGCPKGKWAPRKQRCKVGTRAYEIVRPK